MRITIQVKPNAKQEKVEKMADGSLKVFVKAPPVEGKANKAVVDLLARYFRLSKSQVIIISGGKGRKKWVEIG
ncbi:MAG: DUF167 domain-containing protein [Deltaproteobacteria bacterium]|nr:DUF167 domain-containing protein [Deltaproteobacteria bacterium]MDZ4225110.1 DUF167 domain-containing protein [bacterium]